MNCCGATRTDSPHLYVHDCFERGLVSRRLPALPITGERVSANGLWAVFTLHVDNAGRLSEIRFDTSTCTTLIAYCQALTELNSNRTLDAAFDYGSRSLVAALRGVPTAKYDRAILAAAAFRSALDAAAALSKKGVNK